MTPTARLFSAAGVAAVLGFTFPASAQSRDAAVGYPDRPVHLVVPLGAGSAADIRARQLGQKLAEQWGQPVIVENRPGAGGEIAMEQVARAAPDGYTLVMAGQSAMTIAPHLVKLRFDPQSDFIPVTCTGKGPIILVANTQVPVRTLAEFLHYARQHPGELNAASWGRATITHLALERFMHAAGVRITHVPYKAAGQAVTDLVAGQVQLAFEFFPTISAQLKAGRLRALAVAGSERLAVLPDVPTFTEAGLREMETVSGWQGIAVPAGTPRAIVDKVQAAVARALLLPDIRASMNEAGFVPVGDSPEAFAAFIQSERERWGKLIAEAGIRAE